MGGGKHSCYAYENPDGSVQQRWCGSEYDLNGNERFIASDFPYGFPRMWLASYNYNLNYGYTNFDNMPAAIVTIFQCITMEGWSAVMFSVRVVSPAATYFFCWVTPRIFLCPRFSGPPPPPPLFLFCFVLMRAVSRHSEWCCRWNFVSAPNLVWKFLHAQFSARCD